MNDENQPEVPACEVPRQMADLEHACAHLDASVAKLEKRCVSVISSTLKEGQNILATPQSALCPLAASLRVYARRIETACENIDSLRARMEL